METLPFLFVALMALCVMPSALAIKCYECTNIPGYSASQCGDDTDKLKIINCNVFSDRCMIFTGAVKVPGAGSMDVELRNCSSSILCNPDSEYSMCNILNDTTSGVFSKCNVHCCQGDNGNGAVRISGLLASFVAILLALFLNL
ncbi:uncharacterized protein LOC144628911 isoform X2 [Oculina patagonica]